MSNYQPSLHITATQPPPALPFPSLVLADAGTHPSLRFSRAAPPAVKTWAGTHPRTPANMSFRAQRSGAEESCCRSIPFTVGTTLVVSRSNAITQPFPSLNTSFPHSPVIPAPPSVVPAEARTHPTFNPPVPAGVVREPPVPSPSLVLADAGTHPCSPANLSFRAQRSGAEESCCRSIPFPVGTTLVVSRSNAITQPFPSLNTSFPHSPVIPAPPSVVPAEARTHPSFNPPVPVGAVREPPVPSPSLVLADAGTHPSYVGSGFKPALAE